MKKKIKNLQVRWYTFFYRAYYINVSDNIWQRRSAYDITNFGTSPNHIDFDSCALLYPQFGYYGIGDWGNSSVEVQNKNNKKGQACCKTQKT